VDGRQADLEWDFFDTEKAKGEHDRRSGRYPIFLASFPPPVLQRPQVITRQQDEYRGGRLALRLAECASMQETEHSKSQGRGRRCCGMPLWGFIILLIVLLLLVAAAVVVPIVLIYLPKIRNQHNATAPATTQAGQCAASVTCQNGGVAIMNPDSSCSCLCTNGFTGSHCATSSDADCMTTEIAWHEQCYYWVSYPSPTERCSKQLQHCSRRISSSLSLLLYQSQLYI